MRGDVVKEKMKKMFFEDADHIPKHEDDTTKDQPFIIHAITDDKEKIGIVSNPEDPAGLQVKTYIPTVIMNAFRSKTIQPETAYVGVYLGMKTGERINPKTKKPVEYHNWKIYGWQPKKGSAAKADEDKKKDDSVPF